MAERLTDLLHHAVDDVPVPHPDAFAIATAGRARRTRRRFGTVAVAAVVVAVAGVGVAVVAGLDKEDVEAPVYSHLVYDVTEEKVVVARPDIVIVEGLNVLQPPQTRPDGRAGLAVSDFFDFTIYVDAATTDIRQWYTERFLRLRETAFRNPASYFAKYAGLSHDDAVVEANRIWDEINGPNLAQNVAPTRSRATLVLRKGGDHSVRWVRLRKL